MKYKLADETKTLADGTVLHRIQALKDFGEVKAGDLGGWVESETNLSQEGKSWIYGDSQAFQNAQVIDDAYICEGALVYGHAQVGGTAAILGGSRICDAARITNGVIY